MNVLPFYGIYKLQHDTPERERICLVSPWMENGTLREYLSNHSSRADHCLLAVGVSKGLMHVHNMGIVHGDLKGVRTYASSYSPFCFGSLMAITRQDNILVDQHGLPHTSMAKCFDGTRWRAQVSRGTARTV